MKIKKREFETLKHHVLLLEKRVQHLERVTKGLGGEKEEFYAANEAAIVAYNQSYLLQQYERMD